MTVQNVASVLGVLLPLLIAFGGWLSRGHFVRVGVKADHAERCRRLGLDEQARRSAYEARVLILRPDIIKSRRIVAALPLVKADAWAGLLFGVAAGLTTFQHYFDRLGTLVLGGVQLVLAFIAYRFVAWETDQVQNLATAAAKEAAAEQDRAAAEQDRAAAEQEAQTQPVVQESRPSAEGRFTRAWRELTRH